MEILHSILQDLAFQLHAVNSLDFLMESKWFSYLCNPATKHDLDSLQYYLYNKSRRFVALFRTELLYHAI